MKRIHGWPDDRLTERVVLHRVVESDDTVPIYLACKDSM